jgi:hypothetical protein
MELQGLQEMQAGNGCVLSSGFIHPSVVAEKSVADAQNPNNRRAASCGQRLAFSVVGTWRLFVCQRHQTKPWHCISKAEQNPHLGILFMGVIKLTATRCQFSPISLN